MKKIILGFVLGAIISFAISSFAAMPDGRSGKEISKFVEDGSGNTCVRIYIAN